jgi:hypothetical protein
MKVNISKNNFFEYIEKTSIIKKNDLLICIPTFRSYEVTKETIISFLNQTGVTKDILVTGPSGDIEKLIEDFPEINYCLTKDNFGSSGNQLLNIFICKNYNYKYAVLNDNDARFIDNNSLSIMLENLKENKLLVTFPINNLSKNIDQEKIEFCPFHCCLFNTEIFYKLDNYFLFDYFLIFDDTSFSIKLKKFKDRIKQTKVLYAHPEKPMMFFTYNRMFFFVRSYFSFMLYEKVSIIDKIYYLFLFRPYWSIPMYFIYSILNFDFKFFKIFFIALFQVLTKNYHLISFEAPKIQYKEVLNPNNKFLYKRFNLISDVIFPKKYLSYIDEKEQVRYLKKN